MKICWVGNSFAFFLGKPTTKYILYNHLYIYIYIHIYIHIYIYTQFDDVPLNPLFAHLWPFALGISELQGFEGEIRPEVGPPYYSGGCRARSCPANSTG